VAKLYTEINAERASRSATVLPEDEALRCAAAKHAADIGARGVCSHTGADGSSFVDRVAACGGNIRSGGEIIACGQTAPRIAVDAWLNSPGHAAIMLNPGQTKMGGGVANNYWVVVFSDSGRRVSPLVVHEGKIVDAMGQAVQLRGVSLFWSQWSSTFWNAQAVGHIAKDLRATVIRAAMGVEQGGYLQNPAAEEAKVTAVVEAAVANDLYVIIDWHAHFEHRPEAKAFFTKMARRYANTPNVIFEIWNEPMGVSWGQIRAYSVDIVAAIRNEGAKNIIIVGTPNWSQDVDVAAGQPLPGENIAYALHFYAATHRQQLRDKAQRAIDSGLTLFASEWSTVNAMAQGGVDRTESDKWMAFLDANKIGWANWSLFNKPESASMLRPQASATGPWAAADFTEAGRYVTARLGPSH
jgi:endoglucanase